MTNEVKVIGGIALLSVLVFAGIIFFSSKTAPVGPIEAQKVDTPQVVRSDSHKQGNESAKVTLTEFGDFQCPACGAAYPVIKQLQSNYGDKLLFVFRNLPLTTIHPNAETAAAAAEAAAEQGKFWEMHDILYEKQAEWSATIDPVNRFADLAKEIGLDTNKFKDDIRSKKVADRVALDKGDSNAFSLDSTPSFFINDEPLAAAPTYESLKQKIDEKLAQP